MVHRSITTMCTILYTYVLNW